MHILIMIGIYSILALSLHLILGYTGQTNLAHIVLFGFGAYVSGILVARFSVDFWLTIPIAGVSATLLGFAIGFATLRLRGTYFSLSTFAFCSLILMAFTNLRDWTGGIRGLILSKPPAVIGRLVIDPSKKIIWYYLILLLFLITIWIIDNIMRSRIGRAFVAIREDEDLARSSGINVFWHKMLSFCVSTFFAGVVGAIFIGYMTVISTFAVNISSLFVVIAACVIGGVGTLTGPVIGTLFVRIVPEILRVAEVYYYLIFGTLIIVMALLAPRGVVGWLSDLTYLLRRRILKTTENRTVSNAVKIFGIQAYKWGMGNHVEGDPHASTKGKNLST